MSIKLEFKKNILFSNSIIDFGKYKGEKISWILWDDPSYVKFLIDKMDYVLEGEILVQYEEVMRLRQAHFDNVWRERLAHEVLDSLDAENLWKEYL